MKNWNSHHPKAKLMARKRTAILEAAREAFLRLGYEGASMETIAAAADVSIMTLYRHAESKDALFETVIANVCDPTNEAEQADIERLMKEPLSEILVVSGIAFQQELADASTVALMRVVMAESARFPTLAETAYRGFVGHLEEGIERVLAHKEESRGLSKAGRRRLSKTFIDRLFGADILRVLLGLGGAPYAEQKQRAVRARDELMAVLERKLPARH